MPGVGTPAGVRYDTPGRPRAQAQSDTATRSDLMNAWIAAGGPPEEAYRASAIALAESRGKLHARNRSGATGAWQILGQVVSGNLYDLDVNAKNAVAKYKDAKARGKDPWSPWVTYTNGAYKKFYGSDDPLANSFQAVGDAVGGVVDAATAVPKFLGSLGSAIFSADWWLRVGKILLGVLALAIGVNVMSREFLGIDAKSVAKLAAL